MTSQARNLNECVLRFGINKLTPFMYIPMRFAQRWAITELIIAVIDVVQAWVWMRSSVGYMLRDSDANYFCNIMTAVCMEQHAEKNVLPIATHMFG